MICMEVSQRTGRGHNILQQQRPILKNSLQLPASHNTTSTLTHTTHSTYTPQIHTCILRMVSTSILPSFRLSLCRRIMFITLSRDVAFKRKSAVPPRPLLFICKKCSVRSVFSVCDMVRCLQSRYNVLIECNNTDYYISESDDLGHTVTGHRCLPPHTYTA